MRSNFAATPLGSIAHIEMGQSPDSSTVREGDHGGVPFLQGNAEFGAARPTPRFSCVAPMKMCRAGDILISVRAPVGAMNIADRDYCIGRGLAAVRVPGMSPTLAAHMVSAAAPALRRVSQGTTFEAINKTDLASLVVMAPPEADREPLGLVLDTLDTTIRQTEAIIEKLKQVKQGLLHDLLTRGIDANGELRPPQSQAPDLYKDSPLGWIPREWQITPFRQVGGAPQLGLMVRGASPDGENVGLLKMGNLLAGNQLDLAHIESLEVHKVDRLQDYVLSDGDILFNTRNTPELVGKTCSWRKCESKTVFDNNILRMRVSAQVGSGHFVASYMGAAAGRARLLRLATGTTSVAAIYWKDLRDFLLPLPTPVEQKELVKRLDACDQLVTQEEAAATGLMALKIGLMDDLLTGRVRVTPLLA